jgi:hypothetical protein
VKNNFSDEPHSTFGLCPARKSSPTLKTRLYKSYNYTNYTIYRRVQQLKHHSGRFLSSVHIVFWCKKGHSQKLIACYCKSPVYIHDSSCNLKNSVGSVGSVYGRRLVPGRLKNILGLVERPAGPMVGTSKCHNTRKLFS